MDLETVPETAVKPRRPRARKPKENPTPGATGGVQYIARKPMKIGNKRFKIGDPVPEASRWPRVESWLRAGYIDAVEV